jgi:hypothetical protein
MSREEIGQYTSPPMQRDPYAQRNTYSASLGDCPAPTAQSPLSNVINDLRRKVTALESLTDAMEGKLAPILVSIPESPMKDRSGGAIAQPQSAVVAELAELEYRLGMLCTRIDMLMVRVQA